jgi:hypothetical protein
MRSFAGAFTIGGGTGTLDSDTPTANGSSNALKSCSLPPRADSRDIRDGGIGMRSSKLCPGKIGITAKICLDCSAGVAPSLFPRVSIEMLPQ